jgi:trehalose 6-phosphate phosphatase
MTSTDASAFQLPAQLAGVDPADLVLLLDCDGVLAPIVDDPGAAAVSEATLELVRRAVDRCALTGIVTGRGLERAREMVPVDGAWFATLHGVEITAPGGGETDTDPVSAASREHVAVAATLAQTVGWAYEDKGGTVTIHFRQRGNLGQSIDPAHVKAQLQTVLNPLKVEIHDAKQVLEIKPKGVRTKGDAVRIFSERAQDAKVVAYVGDDLTDLDAFRAMDELRSAGSARSFVKIAVGGEELPTLLGQAADVILDDQSQVDLLLRGLLEA